ncbi:MAG: PH domain-containing protein [archaeon]
MGKSGEILFKESEKTIVTPHWFVSVGMFFLFLSLVWASAIGAAVVVGLAGLPHYLLSGPKLDFGILGPFALVLFLAVFLPLAALSAIECFGFRRNYRFSLQREFVYTRQGTILKTHSLIPYENIQDVQLSEGLFEKLTGTATLHISTPASGTSVPMVPLRLAETLKKEILDLAEKHRGLAE